jgi:quinol monooxygenase YgiN
MNTILKRIILVAVSCSLVGLAGAQQADTQSSTEPPLPAWVQRGMKGAGHSAMAPLVGSWRVEMSIYGTMGRSPDMPPLVSRDIRATRNWIADGHYLEETMEGTVDGKPYWRRGWLGYSNIDRRYEWVTVAPLVPMMIYLGKPGSGERMPIDVSGVFTDQGVVSEPTVGKPVVQRTVIRIESNDRQVSELYFTPPGGKPQLALRLVYTRSEGPGNSEAERSGRSMSSQQGITLPKFPDQDQGETSPYCLIAKHRAKPGLADAYEKRMLADLERTRAETGAVQFHIHRDRFDRDLFVIYEIWRDREALQEHFEQPYVKQFAADSAQYIAGDMQVEWLVMSSKYTPGRR